MTALKLLAPARQLTYNVDIMTSLAEKTTSPDTYILTLGPLEYQLVAHDNWGNQTLAELRAHLNCSVAKKSAPDRVIHLCSLSQGTDNRKEKRNLSEQFESLLPVSDRGQQWDYRRDLVNTIWSSPETRHCFWTAGIDSEMGQFRYHLPWDLLLRDIELYGGGLIHGGLATHQGAALLLLAPPGGGKSTTLSTAPEEWQILSDDAALIWPHDTGGWQASPLPSWSMLNQTTAGPTLALRHLGKPVPVRVMTRLYQANGLFLAPLRPVKAMPSIYRALCEYPAVFLSDPDYRVHFFHIASTLAKQIPSWRLDLPLGADVWPQLETLLEQPLA